MARFKSRVDEDEVISAINTTPLVDVMLVLLIIFLLTVPTILQTAEVRLPNERNKPVQSTKADIVVSVDRQGEVYWLSQPISQDDLVERLRKEAAKNPQPELHIRGDQDTAYEPMGRVLLSAQRVGMAKIAFVTEPPPKN